MQVIIQLTQTQFDSQLPAEPALQLAVPDSIEMLCGRHLAQSILADPMAWSGRESVASTSARASNLLRIFAGNFDNS